MTANGDLYGKKDFERGFSILYADCGSIYVRLGGIVVPQPLEAGSGRNIRYFRYHKPLNRIPDGNNASYFEHSDTYYRVF